MPRITKCGFKLLIVCCALRFVFLPRLGPLTDNTHIATRHATERVQLVILSDRGNKTTPLRLLINSIFMKTRVPVDLHLFSRTQVHWLAQFNFTDYFTVYRYDATPLLNHTLAWMSRHKFKVGHYSGTFTLQKLFLSKMEYYGNPSKLLLLDDDIMLFNDLGELWKLVTSDLGRIYLHCEVDPVYVRSMNQRRPRNGHPARYCTTGIVGIPLSPSQNNTDTYTTLIDAATSNLIADYPRQKVLPSGDQDILNRLYADVSRQQNQSTVDLIPCEWQCHSSRVNTMNHSYCGGQTCKAFHYLQKKFDDPSFKVHYAPFGAKDVLEVDTFDLFCNGFVPRIRAKRIAISSRKETMVPTICA